MPDIVLDLLKYAFIAILYIFVARAVRAVVVEMRTDQPAGASQPMRQRKGKVPHRAVVVEGAAANGKSFDLGDELVVGRGDKCHVVLDDTYVSSVHARIFARGQTLLLEDLGSTNGTYLNRRRVTAPAEVHRGDRVKIGKTVLEMRK